MIERKTVVMLAEVLAIQANIEGMKADNQFYKCNNLAPNYTGSDFNKSARELSELVTKYKRNEDKNTP